MMRLSDGTSQHFDRRRSKQVAPNAMRVPNVIISLPDDSSPITAINQQFSLIQLKLTLQLKFRQILIKKLN